MTESISTGSSRLDAVLSRLGKHRRSGRGYVARCPAHDDRHASLSVALGDDGKVLCRCFAGCDFKAIAAALNMSPADFFPDESNGHSNGANGHSTGTRPKPRDEQTTLTLSQLIGHTRLSEETFGAFGVRNAIRYTGACVEFDYRQRDGSLARTHQRIALTGPKRFVWKDEDRDIIAYEPDGGELARAQGYLIVVEGETDTITLLHMGFPAIGIPGADLTKVLGPEHLESVKDVFVVHEPDQGGVTFTRKIPERLRELEFPGAVHELKMPNAAKDPSALYKRDPDAFEGIFRKLIRDILEPPPHPLHALWKSVGEWRLLDDPPPPQEWVLMRPDLETNGMANPIGLLPRSEVGFLIAAGGVGKSFALIQLALSVATGRKWLDYFLVPTPGRVLILLGEEKLKQAHRRFHDLAHSMRLTDEQVELAKANIVMMPLAGVIAPLVVQDGTSTSETDVMAFLRQHMAEAEWTLVIIDPLSRFAGADTEKDNVQATRFVQVAETLCKVPGAPTVLFAHHTNKASRVDGAPTASAADARGASGTTDGGRWCANLVRRKGGVSLSFTKNNYGQDFDETLPLERAYGGYLRVQSDEARERAREAEEAREAAKTSEVRAKVRAALKREPGLSKQELRPRTKVRDAELRVAVDQMEREGELYQEPKHHYHLRSTSDGEHVQG